MLQILGLSVGAEAVYTDAVSRRDADIAMVAEAVVRASAGAHSSENTDMVRNAAALLAELEIKGLITERVGVPGQYAVTPPAVALEALIAAQREGLRRAEAAAAELSETFRLGNAVGGVADAVEVVSGLPAMRRRFREVRQSAVEEVGVLAATRLLADAPGGSVAGGADGAMDSGFGAADVEPPRWDLRFRVVLERDVLDAPGAAPRLARVLGRREQTRVVHRVPTYLVVADRACAMVQITDSQALVVRAPALVGMLLAGFEAVWGFAEPVRLDASGPAVVVVPVGSGGSGPGGSGAAEAGEPDQFDLRVLTMLLAGATDAVVASQLGVGLRTVQRRIKRLMDLAGVETRIQLGWQARERGWTRG